MIDLYFWTTPNGMKPLLFLEETGLEYRIRPINISKGAQFEAPFLEVSPNAKIPAIVDHAPAGGGAPIRLFESGAILQYLGEKTGRFLPADGPERAEVQQWLFWQMGGLGPMFGQHLHFSEYAPSHLPYAVDRYAGESSRLLGVLDDRLADRGFIAGEEYSIADMASYPWVRRLAPTLASLGEFNNVKRWLDAIAQRPATVAAYDAAKEINTVPTVNRESKAILFGQAVKAA
jgi:GST-like protein